LLAGKREGGGRETERVCGREREREREVCSFISCSSALCQRKEGGKRDREITCTKHQASACVPRARCTGRAAGRATPSAPSFPATRERLAVSCRGRVFFLCTMDPCLCTTDPRFSVPQIGHLGAKPQIRPGIIDVIRSQSNNASSSMHWTRSWACDAVCSFISCESALS